MINDAVAFADTHFDVSFELIKVLFRISEMKIVSCVRAFDDHHKKIPAVIKITVAYRWLKFVSILLNPVLYVNRRLHAAHGHERISTGANVKLCLMPGRIELLI